jgi:hypothetical protein
MACCRLGPAAVAAAAGMLSRQKARKAVVERWEGMRGV